MSKDQSVRRLQEAVEILGLDGELADVVKAGLAKMPEPMAETLLASLEEGLSRFPSLVESLVAPNGSISRKWANEKHDSNTIEADRLPHLASEKTVDDLAIDLGSTKTLIYLRGKGIVLDEPSVVAIRQEGGPNAKRTIQAVGRAAKDMLGRASGRITAIRPMMDRVIADLTITGQMLKFFIKKIQDANLLYPSPRIIISVPYGSTLVERRSIFESAASTGPCQVFLIEEPMAAAIGAGIPVVEPTGSMVVNIGGGITEVGVISRGGIVYSSSVRVGGDSFDDAIIKYMHRNYGMLIGDATAERIKKEIGSAFAGSESKEMEVRGRLLTSGLPRSIIISSNEIREALTGPLDNIVIAVKSALVQTPPDLGADIAEKGMVLTGGGALLREMDRLLTEETGLPVLVADDPYTCVVRGSCVALEEMNKLGNIFANVMIYER